MDREFEWDERKASANEAKHGLSFGEAIVVFTDPGLVEVDVSRTEDGEPWFKVIGTIDGRLVSVVLTRRGTTLRLISARRANQGEKRFYGTRSLHP